MILVRNENKKTIWIGRNRLNPGCETYIEVKDVIKYKDRVKIIGGLGKT